MPTRLRRDGKGCGLSRRRSWRPEPAGFVDGAQSRLPAPRPLANADDVRVPQAILRCMQPLSPEHPLHGSCLCGGVRFEVTGPFRRANYCHCSRCRKHSGAAALAQGRVPKTGFRLLQGSDLIKAFTPPGGMVKAFCRICGSSLFGGSWPEGPEVSIRLGTLDGDPGIRPQYHSFTDSKAQWDQLPEDGLERFPERSPRA